MAAVGRISEVTGTDGERVFEWTIHGFVELAYDLYYWSPKFHLSDSSWSIKVGRGTVNPKSREKGILLNLERRDPGAAKTITYTLGIKGRSGLADVTFTRTESFLQSRLYDKYYTQRGETFSVTCEAIFWNELNAPHSTLTVICRIKCSTPHNVKERNSVSSATQREVLDSAMYRDGEFSSLDVKSIALLSDSMKNMLVNGTTYDVNISVKDKQFRAHRNILSARSPVFAMMLKHNTEENNTGTIRIEDCDPDSFDDFLLHVYSGRTEDLTPSKSLQLYYLADKYDFPVLKERCVSVLKSSLSVTSICDIILLAAKHEEKELLDLATDYLARNIEEILVTVGWQNFLTQNPVEANKLLIKSMKILRPNKRRRHRSGHGTM